MFPLSALLSHAELNGRKTSNKQSVEARRATRRNRCGNLTLFPRIEYADPIGRAGSTMGGGRDSLREAPCVVASISNVSSTGVGLILNESLPDGLEFDVEWPQGEFPVPLRFEVMHSRPMSAGMYRTGARLIIGIIPEDAEPTDFVSVDSVSGDCISGEQPTNDELSDSDLGSESYGTADEAAPMVFAGGILKYDASVPVVPEDRNNPVPVGTFRAHSAHGFDKTETLDGRTTCGWERSISMTRKGERLWVYIHSPGKKNGWGIFVDAIEFESAYNRVQMGASSPFISTLAA